MRGAGTTVRSDNESSAERAVTVVLLRHKKRTGICGTPLPRIFAIGAEFLLDIEFLVPAKKAAAREACTIADMESAGVKRPIHYVKQDTSHLPVAAGGR